MAKNPSILCSPGFPCKLTKTQLNIAKKESDVRLYLTFKLVYALFETSFEINGVNTREMKRTEIIVIKLPTNKSSLNSCILKPMLRTFRLQFLLVLGEGSLSYPYMFLSLN